MHGCRRRKNVAEETQALVRFQSCRVDGRGSGHRYSRLAGTLPRFRVFIARSRQAEAMHNLGNIHTLQKSYNLKYQGFGKDNIWWRGSATSVFGASGGIIMGNGSNDNHCTAAHKNNELGFRAEDCDRLRYTYFVLGNTSAATNDGSGSNFIYPNCDGSMDQWGICFTDPSTCIGDVGTLYHAIDIVAACDN